MGVLDLLRRLGDEALAFGIEQRSADPRSAPFVFFEQTDGVSGHKELIALGHTDEDLMRARAAVSRRASSLTRYALGHVGEVETPGRAARPAVIVELGDRQLGAAMRLARPCDGEGERPIVLSDTENLLERDAPAEAEDWDVLAERYLLVVCPHCDRKNRVSMSRVRGAVPKCGACKQDLAGPAPTPRG